jgi:hypothetical protein
MVDWQSRMLRKPRTKNEGPLHIPLNDTALAVLRVVRARGVDYGRVFFLGDPDYRSNTLATGSTMHWRRQRFRTFTGTILDIHSQADYG